MRNSYSCFFTTIVFIFGASFLRGEELPAFIAAMEGSPVPALSPARAPQEWILAHVDVETTGLVPGYHEMIDIGIVMTDLEGLELDRLFLRIMPDYPERAAPGAVAVNSFSVELWKERGTISTGEAVERMIAFHNRVADGRNALFVGYNAWFDISFVDHLFRASGKTWRELYHYFILDLPSMAWSLGVRDLFGGELSQKTGNRAGNQRSPQTYRHNRRGIQCECLPRSAEKSARNEG